MGKHNIEKKSIGYRLLYIYAIRLHNLIYREFYIINRHSCENEVPAIITPNHQNALMDALAIVFAKDKPLVFLARSDIFKKKSIAAILYFLKILPAYRIRDGFDNLKNNKETFDHTVRALSSNRDLVILPEGNHHGTKKLRVLKKGFARIAFMTELNGNEKINLQILPTAIDYSSYDSFFSRLTVVFGDPFPLKPYLEMYKENPPIALTQITQQLSEELKKLIIHVENEEFHDECVMASAIYAENKFQKTNKNIQQTRFECQRTVTQQLNIAEKERPDLFKEIISTTQKLKTKTRKIPNEILGRDKNLGWFFSFLLSALLIPLAIPGTLIFGLFWYLPVLLTKKKIKDVQFRTSVRFVLYIILFLIILIGFFIAFISMLPFTEALIAFTLLSIAGIVSVKIWRLFYWNFLKLRWLLIIIRNKSTLLLRNELLLKLNKLINN